MERRGEANRAVYIARINRVIDYIEENLGGELNLVGLAEVAGFSRYHFHRLFAAFLGETLGDFIARLRLEKAAILLVQSRSKSVTDIALDCGFTSSATFARAFRSLYGMSASQWRQSRVRPGVDTGAGFEPGGKDRNIGITDSNGSKPESKVGKAAGQAPEYSLGVGGENGSPTGRPRSRRILEMATLTKEPTIRVEEFPETPVAYVRHIGPYQGDGALFERLIGRLMSWAGPRGLLGGEASGEILIIYHDSPEITEPEKLRLSVCLRAPVGTAGSGEVGTMTIPAGRYVRARFEVANDEYGAAWEYVVSRWLPDSGYEPDDRPCFELYPGVPGGASEGKTVVDICMPIRPL